MTLIPLEDVRVQYFPHLGVEEFRRRAGTQSLGFPVVRIDPSQKSTLFVASDHLDAYLDARTAQATKEFNQLKRDATEVLPNGVDRMASGL